MHYFLADLCYYVNFMTVSFLWGFPKSRRLFISVYALSNGSLAWAIIAWRNSLVFHSMDKVTSLFIHIMPPVLLHTLVHLVPLEWQQEHFPAIGKVPKLDITTTIGWASVPYLVWQVLYHLFITVS